MMLQRIASVVAVSAPLFLAAAASGQVTTTGTIQVTVHDQGQLPVPGATVTAESVDSVTKRTAVTNAEGVATLVGLEPSALYVVTTELSGFTTDRHERVLVRSGQLAALRISLAVSGPSETVQVTAVSPIVDTRIATIGQDITLQLTESLPTGRSYQSYLQLVPGVLPDDPSRPGNPASKSGLNYSDIGGELGVSTDNAYYLSGINVTDPVTGTFGANLNTEIIQEQTVITGGIPAEFVGIPGLLSNVITKSGSDVYKGSVNYFFQNGDLVSENTNSPAEEFSTNDAAFTIGGPALRNQLWFFGSYRFIGREDEVTSLDTQQFLRTVTNDQNQSYAKGTWAPTARDTLSFTFLNDPTDISGRRDRDLTNARDRSREQGGANYIVNYSRLFGRAHAEGAYSRHNGEVSDFSAIRLPQNDVIFRSTDARTLADEQLGGFGTDIVDERDTSNVRGSVEWSVGRHTFKGGGEWSQNSNFRNRLTVGGSAFTSLSSPLAGLSAGELASGSFSNLRFNPFNTSDFAGFIRTISASANRASFFDAFDANQDGSITPTELGASLRFSSTAGNPDGRVNYDRVFQSADGPQDTSSDGLGFFIQDTFRLQRFTINAGVRAERWEHVATTGDGIFTFDWEFAPRLSLTYDVRGDGRQKIAGYYGRYYDPIRTNLTNFAGTLTGSVRDEQVFANNEWVTYRTRGGAQVQDALFAPTTETPYTDDVQVGYQIDLGANMSVDATYSNRRTRDIIEDYDLEPYAVSVDGTINYPGPLDNPDSLFLGLDYFGFTQNPGSNFVIATLAGGERNYQGVELTFRKRYSQNWQALAAYTYNDADGNTNSDSNADFQGDDLVLDPRLPGASGPQPGSIRHLFKASGSYTLPVGLEFGGFYRWNSGTLASRTELRSRRNLPLRGAPTEFAGFTDRFIAPGTVGVLTNPSWGQFDLRVQYRRRFGFIGTEYFVDVFNLFDNQDAIRNQDLVAGSGGLRFGDAISFVDPRRFFVGARASF